MSTSSITRSASGNQLASGAQVWSWTFPGAPICINLSRYLVARLQNDLDTRTRALGDSAREIGGLLLGHPRGDDSIVVVDDYAWLPSEPTQNGSYNLNTAELERMRAERAGRSSVVVGYFRTDFGANLELRDAEMDLIGGQFSKSTDVVLLICSSRPHTGGFFFWMGEGVMSPFSLMDFPLDVTRLPFHDDPDAAVPPPFDISSAPVSELAAAAPPVALPAHESEADLVKWPVLEPTPFKIPGSTVVRMPSKQAPVPTALVPTATPVITIAQPPGKKISRPAPSPENAARDNAARESASRGNTARENPARENPAPAPAVPPKAKSVWLTVVWTFALLIGLCLTAGVIVLVFRGGPLPFGSPSATIESKPLLAPEFPLQLTVEAQGTGLNIRWDSAKPCGRASARRATHDHGDQQGARRDSSHRAAAHHRSYLFPIFRGAYGSATGNVGRRRQDIPRIRSGSVLRSATAAARRSVRSAATTYGSRSASRACSRAKSGKHSDPREERECSSGRRGGFARAEISRPHLYRAVVEPGAVAPGRDRSTGRRCSAASAVRSRAAQ